MKPCDALIRATAQEEKVKRAKNNLAACGKIIDVLATVPDEDRMHVIRMARNHYFNEGDSVK